MSEAKYYFEQAYKTGSDIWTHIPYMPTALSLIRELPTGSLVLDMGSGRGIWALRLADLGYRVIGIDYVERAVEVANNEVRNRNIADHARFMVGNATEIPLTDMSMDAVTDIGLLQHLAQDTWATYIKEVARVLKDEGLFITVSLSRDTQSFMGVDLLKATTGHVEKYGLTYYFFTDEEMHTLTEDSFELIEKRKETVTIGSDVVTLLFSKMKKKW